MLVAATAVAGIGAGGAGGGPGGGGEDGDAAVVAPPPGRTRTTPTMAACGESTHKHRAHVLRHDECSRHMMRWGRRAWAAATHNSSDTKNADHDDDDFHVARAFDGHRLFLLGLNLHRGRHIGEWKSKMRQLRRRRGVVTIETRCVTKSDAPSTYRARIRRRPPVARSAVSISFSRFQLLINAISLYCTSTLSASQGGPPGTVVSRLLPRGR